MWQIASFCLSEADSGTDAFAMKMSAVKQGDHYILNGTKLWITNAEHAGVFFVFANAKPTAVSYTANCSQVWVCCCTIMHGSSSDAL